MLNLGCRCIDWANFQMHVLDCAAPAQVDWTREGMHEGMHDCTCHNATSHDP